MFLRALRRRLPLGLVLLAFVHPVFSAPGDILFQEAFDTNLNNWTIVASGGDASLGNETSQSGSSLRMRWGAVTATSVAFDAAVPAARLNVWIRRGSDAFSEDPDNTENLFVEYLDNTGTWITLSTFTGDGTPGQIFTPVVDLPTAALHSALQIRFRTASNLDGFDFDYWHIDDPTVTETTPTPSFGLGICEDFEDGLGDWTIVRSGGDAGVSGATSNSPGNSLFTRWGDVTVTSPAIDTSTAFDVDLSVWIRRGSDSFSEDPDSGEDFIIEFLDDGGNWILLETFTGSGTPGEIFNRTYRLPSSAYHGNFQIRFRQDGGSGPDFDYFHADDVCMTGGRRVIFRLDEATWTGAPNEVIDDGIAGLTGTVFGGAVNPGTNPAISGNPGTCRYGDFDGVGQYIEVPDSAALDFPNAVTVTAWIYPRSLPSELHTIASKDSNYEYHINSSGQVYWYWENSGGAIRTLTSSATITLNQWHHVAITYEPGAQVIYLDGVAVATSSFNESLAQNDLPFYIGRDYLQPGRIWDGLIDEVNIFGSGLSQTDVQTVMMETHPCPNIAPQFAITHDSNGIHCLAETIAVDVVDTVTGTPLTDYNATIVLDTQEGFGTWQLISGAGVFNDATANDGIATYDWALGQTQAVFSLFYPEGETTIDVDVYQQSNPGIRDTDAEGALVFSPSGFTVTAAALPNPPPGTIVPFANAQTAGTDFALHIAAFGQTPNDPTCGIIESYTGNQSVDFWMAHQNPGAGSIVTTVDSTAIGAGEPAAVTSTVNFTNGQAVVTGKYKDAGQIQISVKDSTPTDPDLAAGIRGATAGFVVRPATFVLSNIENAGGTPNPGAADASGAVFTSAGSPFSATVTAIDAEGDVTPNYGQETTPESVALTATLLAPAGGASPPVVSGGALSFTNGVATATDFSWAEVGIVSLQPQVADGDYLGAGNVIGTSSGAVGRFVPHHFDTAINVPSFATACSSGSFTYLGQPFVYSSAPEITVTARALGGQTTQNYENAFFKLSTAVLTDPLYTSDVGTLDVSGTPGGSADPVVTELGGGIASLAYSSGSGLFFVRGNPVAEFDPEIRLSQTVIDGDGVAATANPVVFGAGTGIAFSDGSTMRYGRLRLANAFGSELIDLPQSLYTEYFVSTSVGFVRNPLDSCTTAGTVSLRNFTENLSAGETCVLDTGNPGLSGAGCAAAATPSQQFNAPSISGDFNLHLAAPGAGNDGSVQLTVDAPDWLEFDWDDATPGLEDPTGIAVFGIFGGGSKLIYIRERY